MNLYSLKHKDGYYTSGFCPFCNQVQDCERGYFIQEEDYVSHTMIWCENCGARAVLLENDARKISTQELPLPLQNVMSDEHEAYITPLAKVVKIVNMQFYKYVKKSDKELSLQDLREMIVLTPDLYKPPSEEFTNFLAKWGIEKRIGLNDDDEPDDRYEWDAWGYSSDDIDYTLYLPVNSYNAMSPEQPYPKNFDTSHDGIYVYLQCLDLNGTPFNAIYWGD